MLQLKSRCWTNLQGLSRLEGEIAGRTTHILSEQLGKTKIPCADIGPFNENVGALNIDVTSMPCPGASRINEKGFVGRTEISVVIATLPAVPVPDVWVSINATTPSEELVVASKLAD